MLLVLTSIPVTFISLSLIHILFLFFSLELGCNFSFLHYCILVHFFEPSKCITCLNFINRSLIRIRFLVRVVHVLQNKAFRHGNTVLLVDGMVSRRIAFIHIFTYGSGSLWRRDRSVLLFGRCVRIRMSFLCFICTSSRISMFGKWRLRRLYTMVSRFIWIEVLFRRSCSNGVMGVWLGSLTGVRGGVLFVLLCKPFSSFIGV